MLRFSFITTQMQTGNSQLSLTEGLIETKRSRKHSGEKHTQHKGKILLVHFPKEGGMVTTMLAKRSDNGEQNSRA